MPTPTHPSSYQPDPLPCPSGRGNADASDKMSDILAQVSPPLAAVGWGSPLGTSQHAPSIRGHTFTPLPAAATPLFPPLHSGGRQRVERAPLPPLPPPPPLLPALRSGGRQCGWVAQLGQCGAVRVCAGVRGGGGTGGRGHGREGEVDTTLAGNAVSYECVRVTGGGRAHVWIGGSL